MTFTIKGKFSGMEITISGTAEEIKNEIGRIVQKMYSQEYYDDKSRMRYVEKTLAAFGIEKMWNPDPEKGYFGEFLF